MDRQGRRSRASVVCIFFLGLVISAVMVFRSQVAGDQLNMLARGWLLAFQGEWLPLGNPASGGGAHPGGLQNLLVGLPLVLWADHRAPTILLLAGHLIAYLLLDRIVQRSLGADERFLLAILYWLNPWRMFHSGFLWNNNYLFIWGAFHLATAYELRRKARFWPSFLHLLVLGTALQLDLSALLLVAASGLLWWRRYLRIHLAGALAGAATVLLTLVPWFLTVIRDPGWLPVQHGFAGRGLVFVYPVLRGVFHWLRFPAISPSRGMAHLDFSPLGGPAHDAMVPLLSVVFWALFVPTITMSGWAMVRIWRGRPVKDDRFHSGNDDREWFGGVARWSFLAALPVFGLSPVTISNWNVFSLFQVAVLPLVLVGGPLLRSATAERFRRLAWGYAACFLAMSVAMTLGGLPYRCGGEPGPGAFFERPPLRSNHAFLTDLGIQQQCPMILNHPDGSWVDVLPETGR